MEDLTTKKSKEYFNEIAADYDNSHDGRFVKCMYQELISRVQQTAGRKILDLGCGNGNVLMELAKHSDKELYGLDLSENMIQEAQKRLPKHVQLSVGDSELLPYEEDSFDIVICNASFHHYTKPGKVLQEIKRVLKKDGVFILGDPTAPFGLYLLFLNAVLRWMHSGDYHIYGKKDISKLLQENGFQMNNWKKLEYRAFVLNATCITE